MSPPGEFLMPQEAAQLAADAEAMVAAGTSVLLKWTTYTDDPDPTYGDRPDDEGIEHTLESTALVQDLNPDHVAAIDGRRVIEGDAMIVLSAAIDLTEMENLTITLPDETVYVPEQRPPDLASTTGGWVGDEQLTQPVHCHLQR